LVGKPVVRNGFIDTEGDPFIMEYVNVRKNKDNYNVGYVNIPLLLGGQFGDIYFLVGGKFGLNMFANAKTSSVHNTIGHYPQFIDPFENMPKHSFVTDMPTSDKTEFRLGYNIVASAEIGKTFFFNTKKTRWHYRVALFADYGVMSVNLANNISTKNTDGNFIGIPTLPEDEIGPEILRHNSILTSYQAYHQQIDANGELQPLLDQPRSINPLLVGIKFTLLFDLGNKAPCNCLPEYKSKWTKGGRQRTSYIKKYKTPSGSMGYKK
jgi:hypothetical protein